MKVLVCVATYNRRDTTLSCITSLLNQFPESQYLEWNILDDKSNDGTFESLIDLHLDGNISQSSGNLFWSKSMSLLMSHPIRGYDFILLINDDVRFFPGSLRTLLESASRFPLAVLVGQTEDSANSISYGGYQRFGLNPIKLKRCEAFEEHIEVDTFNCNIVLIPNHVLETVGPIDGQFEHSYGDIDFGYRIKKNGFSIKVVPGFLGACDRNIDFIGSLGRKAKLAYLLERKQLPWRSQYRFMRRHAGFFWPLYFLSPYLKVLLFNQFGSRS